ncbi:MAG: Lipoprotein-releasing system transmembrane protein LolE [Chlamydiae bacterium]|nr:Lipoprotein-releasing system transmembrane protein LolE [Chlamydiota bacterium]
MFEFSVACKYLIPRWRQLSVSIISMISILVISLVVWLILVFFSVTNGLEKNWVEKLLALTAPVRITPTQEYFDSYYYQIDSISEASDYSYKSLREKVKSPQSDPYQSDFDEEIPMNWSFADENANGELKDIVQLAFQSAEGLEETGLSVSCFETSVGNLQLQLIRKGAQSQLNQSAYLNSFDPQNQDLKKTLLSGSFEGEIPSIGGTDGILLPKNFQEAGVLAGDRGVLSYHIPTTSSMQEQRIPVYVAGFYDQGVIPIGGRFVWVNPDVISMVSSAFDVSGGTTATGINVRFDDFERAGVVKAELEKRLEDEGIASYWKVETFREFAFTKDLLQQLRSQKNLFSIISIVIIIIACSNIISMLIILVNDKKMEIGILRSMGASSKSIAAIFGFCGVIMGLLGSLIGIALAVVTLQNIHLLIDFISYVQGHELLNARFFGDVIPNQINGEALTFVLVATVLISLISGIIPAVKASMMKPSDILRSE